MNYLINNTIRSLSTAEYLKLNFVTFIQQMIGQAILIGLCYLFLLVLPELLVVIATLVIFTAAWFLGQAIGGKIVQNYGVEFGRVFVKNAWVVTKLNLLGTTLAFLLGGVLVYTFLDLRVLFAYTFVNGCICIVLCLVALEVGSVESEEEKD